MKHKVALGLSALFYLTASPGTAFAQGATVSSPVDLARQAESLKPGQWVWAPGIAPEGPVLIYVDLSDQTASVYRNGVRIAVTTVSSGRPGHETPTGVFTILQKDPNHHSSKYNDAPMPFQERLTWDGVALHAGGLPGYPSSHGCVHLPYDFSKLLFGITQLGGTVVVAGAAGRPVATDLTGVLAPADTGLTQSLPSGLPFAWNPSLAPSGPLTIVVSKSDQQMIVLRNGVEIGRARTNVPNLNFETHVLTYAGTQDGHPRWVFVDVPGQGDAAGKPVDMSILSRTDVPAQFLAALQPAIVPGTTMLVTEAPITTDTTGQKLTVIDSAGPTAAR